MNNSRSSNSDRPANLLLLSWMICAPLGLLSLYLKRSVVVTDWGLLHFDSRIGLRQWLSFYRTDLIVGFIVVPAIVWGLLWITRRRLLLLLCMILSAAGCWLFVEVCSYFMSRTFASLDLVIEAITFAKSNFNLAEMYLPPGWRLKLAVIVLAPFLAAFGGNSLIQRLTERQAGALTVWTCSLLVVLVGGSWFGHTNEVQYQKSIAASIASSLWTNAESPDIPLEELAAEYQRVARTSGVAPARDLWGRARGSDVLWFVLETVPAAFVDLEGDLQEFPAIRRLRERAWVGTKHLATYPMTNRSFYSLLSSQYPPEGYREIVDPMPAHQWFVRLLNSAGYETAAYGLGLQEFEGLIQSQGFRHADYCSLPGLEGVSVSATWRANQRVSDENCLKALTKDLQTWIRQDRRYAAVFAPQVGHAPWGDLEGVGDLKARCRELLRIQDRWLGQILDLLAAEGRLDRTLILLVADHGVRLTKEDPSLNPRMLDDRTFHVPMMLAAPPVLKKTEYLRTVTSHIDVAPSFLDLLGIERNRIWEQGTTIWNGGLENRRTCFWATQYYGADGCYDAGQYVMWSRTRDLVYASTQLQFSEAQPVGGQQADRARMIESVQEMDRIRKAWIRNVRKDTRP